MSTNTRMLHHCQSELERIIEELDSTPSRTAFYDIGAVAEVLVLTPAIPAAQSLLQILSQAAARWLHTGLLEDLLVAQAEFAYHTSLLCYLARGAAASSQTSTHHSDMQVIHNLYQGRLIARSEAPVLRQCLITGYLAHCGVATGPGQLGTRNMTRIVDKRVLRARSDEFDLLVLLLCAQLIQLEPTIEQARPTIYPELQLLQAIRSQNSNWVPVLTLLCQNFFKLSAPMQRTAFKSMRASAPPPAHLLPAPPLTHIDSEYIARTERGLRLRSTIALALLLTPEEGDLYDDSKARATYA